jgi:hypothetical protein
MSDLHIDWAHVVEKLLHESPGGHLGRALHSKAARRFWPIIFAERSLRGGACGRTDLYPFQTCPPNRIPDHMLACRLLDLTESCGVRIDRVIGLKFPAYLIPHPNKVIWLLHQHRTAYELWDHPLAGDLIHYPDGPVVREAIHRADRDTDAGSQGGVYFIKKRIGPPAAMLCGSMPNPCTTLPRMRSLFYNGPAGDYLFFPSRVTGVKRQLLVIQALAKCRERWSVYFAGEADSPAASRMRQAPARTWWKPGRVAGRGFRRAKARLVRQLPG